jgi:ferredoxin
MELAERALLAHGTDPGQIFVERFEPAADGPAADGPAGQARDAMISILLSGRRRTVSQHSGETLLQSARRAGLAPPFSCEAGNCATCMARVTKARPQCA